MSAAITGWRSRLQTPESVSLADRGISRARRLLILLALPVVLIGSCSASYFLVSSHIERQTIVLEPGSHYAFRFGIYGLGTVSYSESGLTGTWGSEVYIMDMDRYNYERFVSGKPYAYMGYSTVGSGGEGHSFAAGPIWEHYVVIVNEGPSVATVSFEGDSRAYLSLPVAALIAAAYGGVWHLVNRPLMRRWFAGLDPEMARMARLMRLRMNVVILALVGLAVLMYFAIRTLTYELQGEGPGVFSLGYLDFYLGMLLPAVLAFLLRFRIVGMKGDGKKILADLASRLRATGFMVSRKREHLIVNTSRFFATKISARESGRCTTITYQAYATPSGWTLWFVMLFLFAYAAPVMLGISLLALRTAAVFTSEHVLGKLVGPPVALPPDRETRIRMLLIESLSESKRLSQEALQSAKSRYHDWIAILVVLGLGLGSGVLALISVYALDSWETGAGLLYALGLGAAAGLAFVLIGWRVLASRVRDHIKDMASWAGRLEAALKTEISAERPPDGTMSSFELIAESFKQMPIWLEERRKGAMTRDPGTWFFLFFLGCLCYSSATLTFFAIGTGRPLMAGLSLLLTIALCLVILLTYRRWKGEQNVEAVELTADWKERFQTLRSEMESYLGSV
ncbi:MAG: hypothetical protein QXU73_07300 [Thermoplasmata archaeon]